MAFKGKRKGFRVSNHLNRLSDAKLIAKMDRYVQHPRRNARTDEMEAKVFNIAFGILKSRGVITHVGWD